MASTNGTTATSWWRRVPLDQRLVGMAIVWLLALAIPSLRTSVFGLLVTVVLLVSCFIVSVGVLMTRKRILMLLNLVQIALFTFLPYQLYSALGQHHYSPAHDPSTWDWIHFTLAQVIRATDILDILASYGIELQNIKYASFLSRAVVVWLRIAVDLFLFAVLISLPGMLARALARQQQGFQAPDESLLTNLMNAPAMFAVIFRDSFRDSREQWKKARGAYLFLCLVTLALFAFFQGWSCADWFWWPVDNLVRIVDFPGVMDIFDLKLHTVHSGFWTQTLGIAFRFLCGVYLLSFLAYLNLRVLGKYGLRTIESFIPDFGSDNARTRELAIEALAGIGRDAITDLVVALGDADAAIVTGARQTLDRIDPNWPQSAEARTAVMQLVKKLQGIGDLEGEVQKRAARALAVLGPNARAAIPALVYSLANDFMGSAQEVRIALAHIDPNWPESPEARETIASLIKVLGNGSLPGTDRRTAAVILGEFGPIAKAAIPVLAETLPSRDELLRKAVLEALVRMGPDAGPVLIARLQSLSAQTPREELLPVISAVGQLGPPASALAAGRLLELLPSTTAYQLQSLVADLCRFDPTWTESPTAATLLEKHVRNLSSGNVELRQRAMSLFHTLGPGARSALPACLRILGEDEMQWRMPSLLDKMEPNWRTSPEAGQALGEYIRDLSGTNMLRRQQAVLALSVFEQAAEPAVPLLIPMLADATLAESAASVLHKIGPAARSAVAALTKVLAANPELPWAGAALGKIGPPAASAVSVLIAVVANRDPGRQQERVCRQEAAEALNTLAPDWAKTACGQSAVAVLMDLLQTGNDEVKRTVLMTLTLIGTPAQAAMPVLINLLVDGKGKWPAHILSALDSVAPGWKDRPAAQPIIQTLARRLPAASEDLRGDILATLERIGPPAACAAPEVMRLLVSHPDVDPMEPVSTLNAIAPGWAQGPAGQEVVTALVRRLKNVEALHIPIGAVMAFGEIGPPARVAVPLLKSLLAEEYLSQHARQALEKIDPIIRAPV